MNMHPKIFTVVCQYCNQLLQWRVVDEGMGGTSHGICDQCLNERYPDKEQS